MERTFAWISKFRRCIRDYETVPAHHEAIIHITVIMAGRPARKRRLETEVSKCISVRRQRHESIVESSDILHFKIFTTAEDVAHLQKVDQLRGKVYTSASATAGNALPTSCSLLPPADVRGSIRQQMRTRSANDSTWIHC
jgi:hypothetical protein